MSLWIDVNKIEVDNIEPSVKKVSKMAWCDGCRKGKHSKCSGFRRELRNGIHKCECPSCAERRGKE